MAIIYKPITGEDPSQIRYNNGNVDIILNNMSVGNVLEGYIDYFIDNKRIFVICTRDGIIQFIDIKKSSEIFDIEFTQQIYQISVMNSKFINKIKELICLFDLSETPFREVFAEFIDPIIKSAIY
jgi:hypothetical protein